jgi:hypothetical protein
MIIAIGTNETRIKPNQLYLLSKYIFFVVVHKKIMDINFSFAILQTNSDAAQTLLIM